MPIIVSAQNLSYDLIPDITATRNLGSSSQAWNNAWLTTVKAGTWNGSVVGPAYGGTGIANNAANTLTFSGLFALTLTLTAATSVTLPTSGTLVSSTVTTLSSLASIGTVTTGVWQGTVVAPAYGGTGVANGASNTITFTGNYTLGLTLSGNTSVTLPTTGTLLSTGVTTLASLVSVGTITTGVWNATVVGAAYGGTGVANNASSTITISGAYGLTLTLTALTSVTLPSAGTLATLAGTETLNNKTMTTPIIASLYQAPGGGLISVPASVAADTVCLIAATQTLNNKTVDILGIKVGTGTLSLTASVTSGTWTMTLPPGVGTSGQQLTTDGTGVTVWSAPGSLREWKNVLGLHSPQDSLDKILSTRAYDFHFKEGKGTGDTRSLYTGVMADGEFAAPWAMHYREQVLNPINAFGHAVGAIQAMNEADWLVAQVEKAAKVPELRMRLQKALRGV